jgi:hypothetical protein
MAIMTTDRPNTPLAAAVDQALAVADEYGARAAARFLTEAGADFALACRVLAEPARRRACTHDLPSPSS